MHVSTQTKTKVFTAVFLGAMGALSCLPTWASTTPGNLFPSASLPVVSTQGTQDLSVLWDKLQERFAGVTDEVRSLINGEKSSHDSLHGVADSRVLDLNENVGIRPAIVGQDFFVDIGDDPYRSYINRLAAYGVLSPSSKFFPQNYFRVDDFISLLTKLYRKTTGQSLTSQQLLGITADDGLMTKWVLQQAMQSLALGTSLQMDGNPYDKLTRSEGAYFLVRMFDLPVLDIDEQSSDFPSDAFVDIDGHPFAYDINVLANLGIANAQFAKFYPDNYVRHYDFVTLFVNALLVFKDQSLSSIHVSPFADVDAHASYLDQVVYAADRGLIDAFVTSRGGQLYFEPNSFVTKQQAYQLLSKALNMTLIYDDQQAGVQYLTRGELAYVLVQALDLSSQIVQDEPETSLDAEELSLVERLRTLLSVL